MTGECGHEFLKKPGIKCGSVKGHKGYHSFYGEGDNPNSFTGTVWNDNGETPARQEEYGMVFPCDYDDGHDERQNIMSLAIFDVKKQVPKGTVFEIRSKLVPKDTEVFSRVRDMIPRDRMAKKWGIAWYYIPDVKQPKDFENYGLKPTPTEPLFQHDIDEGEESVCGGYLLLARIKA